MTHILHIDASPMGENSKSHELSLAMVQHIEEQHDSTTVHYRDISAGLPFVDAELAGAYYTDPNERTDSQREKIALSDTLVDELQKADIIVAGVPMHNFTVSSSFKAWIDLVARVGRTFKYTDNGPVGLLEGKKAYITVATGGTKLGSDIDYLSDYVRHVFSFMGITDVEIIGADQVNSRAEEAMNEAKREIEATDS